MPDMSLLSWCLEVAVPIRIAELLELTPYGRAERVRAWASAAGEMIASNGDTLVIRRSAMKATNKWPYEPGTADTFNHAARAVAAHAMTPGGVLLLGRHWCVEHPRGKSCASVDELDCGAGGLINEATGVPAVVTVTTTEVL